MQAVSSSCQGSLYGPNGEHMGGNWAMDLGRGNQAAAGIFVGDYQGQPSVIGVTP